MTLRGYAVRRLALGAVQIVAVAVLVFAAAEALPGDAAVVAAGEEADGERIADLRRNLGLDRPATERLWSWLGGLAEGDLGRSVLTNRPVGEILQDGFPATAVLGGVTAAMLVPLSIGLGLLCGRREGSRLDRVVCTATVAAHAVPEFGLALLLVALFSLNLELLPATAVGAGAWEMLERPSLLVLPVVVLLCRSMATVTRLVRAGVIDVGSSPFVAQAGYLGLPMSRVLWCHVLPNALAPAVQALARATDWLLAGVVVVESVFVVPGVGRSLVDAVAARDVPVVQGIAVLAATVTVVVNLVADLVGHALVPRAS